MLLPRWQKHWWEGAAPVKAATTEPNIWVDPALYVEAEPRLARGSIPPPLGEESRRDEVVPHVVDGAT